MAERKAVNKYYPPDWDPRKGSVNKRVGQHPLRDRAKKLSQGILVIRFELPYNIWCGGCGSHVGMGVRYNAEKSKVGNYYSTPIYKFRMKCHLCDNYFEIQTDPQNHDYVILSGARRKEQRWDPHANEQIVPEDKATQKKMATDAMYKLEHGSDDKQKGSDRVSNLAHLEESRISMVDDYILNRMARDKFRAEKKVLNEAAEADRAILERASLDIELVEEREEDRKVAGLLKYTATSSFEDKQKEKRKSIEMRPLFEQSKSSESTKSSSVPASSDVLPYQRHSAPTMSRRGELKQKLGWALKASYKDPFKSSGVSSRQNTAAQSFRESPRSLLGIRLKSSGALKAAETATEQNKVCDTPSTDVAEDCSVSSNGAKGATESGSLRGKESKILASVAKDSPSEVGESSKESHGDGQSLSSSSGDNSSVETVNASCSSHDILTPQSDTSVVEISTGRLESPKDGPEIESVKTSDGSRAESISPAVGNLSKNTSGLNVLMSSYTESDSGSDSS